MAFDDIIQSQTKSFNKLQSIQIGARIKPTHILLQKYLK